MLIETNSDPSPKKVARRKLRQDIENLKMDKRVGKYTSDANDPTRGIFKAPAAEQKVFRKNLKSQIAGLRSQRNASSDSSFH